MHSLIPLDEEEFVVLVYVCKFAYLYPLQLLLDIAVWVFTLLIALLHVCEDIHRVEIFLAMSWLLLAKFGPNWLKYSIRSFL